jgi:hypothetical protein
MQQDARPSIFCMQARFYMHTIWLMAGPQTSISSPFVRALICLPLADSIALCGARFPTTYRHGGDCWCRQSLPVTAICLTGGYHGQAPADDGWAAAQRRDRSQSAGYRQAVDSMAETERIAASRIKPASGSQYDIVNTVRNERVAFP